MELSAVTENYLDATLNLHQRGNSPIPALKVLEQKREIKKRATLSEVMANPSARRALLDTAIAGLLHVFDETVNLELLT